MKFSLIKQYFLKVSHIFFKIDNKYIKRKITIVNYLILYIRKLINTISGNISILFGMFLVAGFDANLPRDQWFL